MKQSVCLHGGSDRKSVGGRRNKREDEGPSTSVHLRVCDYVFLCVCVFVCSERVTGKQEELQRNERKNKCVLCVGGRENETGRCKHVCVCQSFVHYCRDEAGESVKKKFWRGKMERSKIKW